MPFKLLVETQKCLPDSLKRCCLKKNLDVTSVKENITRIFLIVEILELIVMLTS